MKNLYLELKNKHSEELNNFPMAFAFSDKQFQEGLDKLGVTKDEACSVPGGGFIRKTDSKALMDMFLRHSKEEEEAIAADKDGTGYIYQAFVYELNNHEHCITCDVTDTLDSLGLTMEEIEANPIMKAALIKAKRVAR